MTEKGQALLVLFFSGTEKLIDKNKKDMWDLLVHEFLIEISDVEKISKEDWDKAPRNATQLLKDKLEELKHENSIKN